MIGFLIAAAVTATLAPGSPDGRYEACAKLAESDPAKALTQASEWRDNGGGVLARTCVGLALAGQERWPAAQIAFEEAAKESEIHADGHAAPLWVQAGNAALAADDPSAARSYLDRALAQPGLPPSFRESALVDRARAEVASSDAKAARSDLDEATRLAPADYMAWLFSATLARRQGDLVRARREIAEAARLAPNDEAVRSESRTIDTAGAAPARK